jgi:hypothetical protein
MTETKNIPTVEEEIATLDREIRSLEAELEEQDAPLAWGEVDADELVRKEQRRSVLPRLITAAKIRRLELEKRRTEEELEPLRAEREAAGKKLERLRKKQLEMEEEIREAQAPGATPTPA